MARDDLSVDPEPNVALELIGEEGKTGEEAGIDECPEGGYGWVVVACIAAVNATTWGLNTTYGVYQSFYIQNNYFDGGSPLRYAFVGGLSVGTAFILAPIANYLSKRFTFRVPMLLGIVCATLGQALAGISTQYGMLVGFQGVVFGLGLGLTLVPCQPLLAHWFDKRLALAQGLSNAGSGVGGLIFSNTTRLAIETVGLKYSLVINGLISLCVLTPAVILMRGRVKVLNAKSEPLQIHYLWHPGFLWVWLQGMFAMMGFFITVFSLASYASDALGLSQTKAAALQSILSAGQMFGRPMVGLGLDYAGRINTTIIIHFLSGLSCFAFWLPARSFALLAVFAITIGGLGGTVWGATPPIAQSVIGTQHLASALGVYWVIVAAPACMASPIAISLLDRLQGDAPTRTAETYQASIALCGVFYITAGVVALGAKRYVQGNWRIMQKA